MMSRYFFRSFTNASYCVLSHIPMIWRHVKVVWQRTSRAMSRHSFITSVVIQHLVSDRLLSLISKKMYIMLDKTEISLKVALNIITLTTNIINTLITMSYLHFILTVLFLFVYILVIFFRGIKASHILLSADGYVTLTGIRNAYSMIKNGHRLRSVHEYPITCVSMLKWFSPEILSQVKIEN